jgi:hypothetical protein
LLLLWLLPLLLSLPLCLQQCLPLDVVDDQLLSSPLEPCAVVLTPGMAGSDGLALQCWHCALKHKYGLHLVEQQPTGVEEWMGGVAQEASGAEKHSGIGQALTQQTAVVALPVLHSTPGDPALTNACCS